ncbi:S-adenosyl-L-methionine-dependent methyltransferase [Hyaloraphidium curvatum]|nr:S-adenosyl-L-methionine-dependent methyltransferase [Hyaloraphidium curvatum]
MKDAIRVQGPLTVAQYMTLALTSALGGYYMRGDVFGARGDFVTGPEISQMYGELVGFWFIMQWEALGKPIGVSIVELGPGRGTLMADMLRILRQFPDVYKAIGKVELVEAGPELSRMQARALTDGPEPEVDPKTGAALKLRRKDGLEFEWHAELAVVARDRWSFFIAHEFFDALPVNKFEARLLQAMTDKGWREIMVDVDESPGSDLHFRYVLAPKPTPASGALSLVDRYRNFRIGDRIEVSPECFRIGNEIAKRIHASGGTALIIDYGHDRISSNSLRAIKSHGFRDALSSPGESDLSVDVDFSQLRAAAEGLAAAFGPVTQSRLLHELGIQARLEALLRSARSDGERKELVSAYDRLTSRAGMGETYKALALGPLGSAAPVAFTETTPS